MALVTISAAEINAGLLEPGFGLGASQFTFSIPTTGSTWPRYEAGSEPFNGYAVLNAGQAAIFRAVIGLWDALIAPNFTEVADDAGSRGELRAAFSNIGDSTAAYAYSGNPQVTGGKVGDVWINSSDAGRSFARGTYEYEVLIHEIGHTLGLKHTFDAPALPAAFESTRYTVMSYSLPRDSDIVTFALTPNSIRATTTSVLAVTPMVLDIAAVQERYGADLATRTGDDVYRFDQNERVLQSIYDAGGNDTIDLSNFTRSNTIDLRAGSYSSIGEYGLEAQIADWVARFPGFANFIRQTLTASDLFTNGENLGIAFTTTIENAIGGSAADRITGNAVANVLSGGGGNDTIDGGGGADIIDGGGGDDVLTGGTGGDLFRFAASGSGSDRITDFDVGVDRFDLGGGVFTAVSEDGGGTLLSFAGGTIRLDAAPVRVLAEWNALVTNVTAPTPTPPPPPPPPPPPTIAASAQANVAENVGATFYTPVASAAEGGVLSFAISGADAARFAIDATTGALRLLAPADFEAGATAFTLTITATDTTRETSASQAVSITLTDVNEAPAFALATRAISVAENSAASALVVSANARDPDGGFVFFSVTGADAGAFTIDAASGEVRFRASPDFEMKSAYGFDIVATDRGGLVASQSVTITVADVNEAPTFALTARSVTIAENSAIATIVVTGAASDPDAGAVLRYSLSGSDAAAFVVDAASGAVTFRASPDFEVKAAYAFSLVATDQGGLSSAQAVNVAIGDVVEVVAPPPPPPPPPPFFLLAPAGAAASVQGSGTVFGTVGGTQAITVLDTPGRITFDGSFNTGGDRIMLAKAASAYTVARIGAAAEISDGDTVIVVPIGTGGADIVFGDGVRSLTADTSGAVPVLRLGSQALTTSAATITAAPGPAVATGAASAEVGAQLLVSAGASVTALGKATVFGTIAGAETVTVAPGARLTFDGSFNAGGDTIVLPGTAAGYTAARLGSALVLSGGGASATIPLGIAPLTVAFDDGTRAARFDVSGSTPVLRFGDAIVSAAPVAAEPDFATFTL